MKILKHKPEPTGTISLRIPASLKSEIESLRKQCNEAGFDLSASLTDALVRTLKQINAEIAHFKERAQAPVSANGTVKLS